MQSDFRIRELDTFLTRDIPFLKKYDTKIIVNVCGKSKEDYIDAVEKLSEAPVDMLEINISCPNVKRAELHLDRELSQQWR